MARYDKEFREQRLKLFDEIGPKKAANNSVLNGTQAD